MCLYNGSPIGDPSKVAVELGVRITVGAAAGCNTWCCRRCLSLWWSNFPQQMPQVKTYGMQQQNQLVVRHLTCSISGGDGFLKAPS